MLENLYDSWGFDIANKGMATLADQGVIGYEEPLEKDLVIKDNQFFDEEGFVDTDLVQGKCACSI